MPCPFRDVLEEEHGEPPDDEPVAVGEPVEVPREIPILAPARVRRVVREIEAGTATTPDAEPFRPPVKIRAPAKVPPERIAATTLIPKPAAPPPKPLVSPRTAFAMRSAVQHGFAKLPQAKGVPRGAGARVRRAMTEVARARALIGANRAEEATARAVQDTVKKQTRRFGRGMIAGAASGAAAGGAIAAFRRGGGGGGFFFNQAQRLGLRPNLAR